MTGVTVASGALPFSVKSCISSFHFRWWHRCAKKKKRERDKRVRVQNNHVRHKHGLLAPPIKVMTSDSKRWRGLHSGHGNTRCSRGRIQRQIGQVSQSQHLESQPKSNYNNSRDSNLWLWTRLGYIQSGRYAQVFETLFTSNLRTITSDSFLHPKQITHSFSSPWEWKGRASTRSNTYAATLIILGPKASTCLSRAFIVFPVPTMAYRAEEKKLALTWKPKPDLQYARLKSDGKRRSQTVLELHN